MSPLYITLVHDQGHCLDFPTDPDHPRPLISHITLTTQPLISDAMGAPLSLLQLRESPRKIRADFRSEGVESKEVSELPLEEVEMVRVQRMLKVSEVGVGKTLRYPWSTKQVIP